MQVTNKGLRNTFARLGVPGSRSMSRFSAEMPHYSPSLISSSTADPPCLLLATAPLLCVSSDVSSCHEFTFVGWVRALSSRSPTIDVGTYRRIHWFFATGAQHSLVLVCRRIMGHRRASFSFPDTLPHLRTLWEFWIQGSRCGRCLRKPALRRSHVAGDLVMFIIPL